MGQGFSTMQEPFGHFFRVEGLGFTVRDSPKCKKPRDLECPAVRTGFSKSSVRTEGLGPREEKASNLTPYVLYVALPFRSPN